ncbi:hypothetical protein NP233_g6363 [Leucocoprinus birnbaumii]|uniref:ATP-dependent DNA helicase n=1 Tax=Leucocoprinus birnbaumii TaxID=56174 RepID=A0AAD5VTZ4_9AGAR|nr:hypothetical protein NP233_g6363 [Leucocoprinus birnbaumii]
MDPNVLERVSTALKQGSRFEPDSDEEKRCFRLLSILDYVAGKVKGSITQKKYMQTDIWSLMSARGAPTWFITFSPADSKHPLCLYLAGTDVRFKHELLPSSARYRLVSENPVAAARFFDILVRLFIKHVLGVVNDGNDGVYGPVASYYGTVEQQGHLTLHLHCLVWVRGALSPQQIRDRLLSSDNEFERNLLDYLESCSKGEFYTGTLDRVKDSIVRKPVTVEDDSHSLLDAPAAAANPDPISHACPTLTMPVPPPSRCSQGDSCDQTDCGPCAAAKRWWETCYVPTVDELILKSNIHTCRSSAEKLAQRTGNKPFVGNVRSDMSNQPKGCLNKYGICGARFPRDVYEHSFVDREDGHIFLQKREPMMNSVTPLLTYVMRCNTDSSCLLSGTAIKSTISYVADYICKSSLKTYHVLKTACDVFQKRNDILNGTKDSGTAARKLVLKVVNSLAPKMELGSPLASLYLLGNPDHYTDAEFINFWWRSFVNRVYDDPSPSQNLSDANILNDISDTAMDADELLSDVQNVENISQSTRGRPDEESVLLLQNENKEIIGWSAVDDYVFRPAYYENICLLDWIRGLQKRKIRHNRSQGDRWRPFLPDHPMSATHEVALCPDRARRFIPRYLGGSLPCRDSPDPSLYHCTMLAFFKPWRSRHDILGNRISWSEAFFNHDFTDDQRRLMDNFNLRYECLDARDDYHANMNSQIAAVVRNESREDRDDDVEDVEDDNETFGITTIECDRDIALNSAAQLTSIQRVSLLMLQNGWKLSARERQMLDFASTRTVEMDTIDVDIPPPQVSTSFTYPDLSINAWKEKIKEQREQYLKSQRQLSVNAPSGVISGSSTAIPEEKVVILDASYFSRSYKFSSPSDQIHLGSVVNSFKLNSDQERAFRIIAQHALTLGAEQLCMYLGGMAGTGKSQVLKALRNWFSVRNEGRRLIEVAPTGTAAALLGGSTYHYILGLTSFGDPRARPSQAVISEARERLQGVEYIFLDEVSMVSCSSMYQISKRLSEITGEHSRAFGGLNVILAGDFAQLPPTGGKSLYHQSPPICPRMSLEDQENIIGKLIWHQVTTVVLLEENMRQTADSPADRNFRSCLENMRYTCCTAQDISFLESRTAKLKSAIDISVPPFRNVPVITARNIYKDHWNEIGSVRYARDTNQTLIYFYSVDTHTTTEDTQKKKTKFEKYPPPAASNP